MGKKKVISKAKLKQMVEERDNDESRIEFIATEVALCGRIVVTVT